MEHNHIDDSRRISAAQSAGCLMVRQISTIGLKTDDKYNYSVTPAVRYNTNERHIQNFNVNAIQSEADNGNTFEQIQ